MVILSVAIVAIYILALDPLPQTFQLLSHIPISQAAKRTRSSLSYHPIYPIRFIHTIKRFTLKKPVT